MALSAGSRSKPLPQELPSPELQLRPLLHALASSDHPLLPSLFSFWGCIHVRRSGPRTGVDEAHGGYFVSVRALPFYSISLVSVDDVFWLWSVSVYFFAETVLEQTIEDLDAEDLYLDRKEKQFEEIDNRILFLQSSLVDAKVLILHSSFFLSYVAFCWWLLFVYGIIRLLVWVCHCILYVGSWVHIIG